MDLITYICIGYIILVILICEYIYHFRYIPNMRRLAANNYRDL
jgi:hypothetical protein